MPYDTILFEVRERVAYITLNRPEQLNALSFPMRAELSQAFDACAADDAVRAVVLAGAGRAFCAGVDLGDGSFEESPVESVEVRVRGDFRAKLVGMGKPTVAAVQGYALGGGCELALCCDLRLAAEDAQFGLPEINLGSIPAGGATQRLPRLIGPTRALELLMTGDRLPADEAYRLGLVNRVVPRDALPDAAAELAGKLAAKAPLAIRYLREAVYRGLDLPLDDGIRLEAYLGGLLRTTEDRVEGLAAFREKRPPNFQGR
ncbi:MAG TPA: enoyl-CoA hydratase/isomerase family protein [Chloroflexota bacterium]|nr:enoyl-CoA hydratase/isomerase family protein [Chloroflexota bacterium]